MLIKFSTRVVLCLALLGSSSANAAGQATPTGGVIGPLWSGASTSRGSAIAFDPRNNVYLAISAYGTLRGRFISQEGVPDTAYATFVIPASANYTHFPEVEYSPDADGGNGAFLVIWHESDQANGGTSIHSRLVSFTRGGPFGPDRQLVQASSFFEASPGLAYAPNSKRFLAVWGRQNFSAVDGILIGNDGAALSAALTIAVGSGGGVGKAAAAYNSSADNFLVSFSGWDPTPFVKSVIVSSSGVPDPNTNAILNRSGGTYQTDVTFNADSGQFLVAWYQDPGPVIAGRLVTAAGSPTGNVIPLSTRFAARDSVNVTFNPATGTSLVVAQDALTVENGGVEISAAGVPGSAAGFTALGGSGNYHPKSAANTGRSEWTMVTAASYNALYAQRISTTSRSTGTGRPAPGPATLLAPSGTISQGPTRFTWNAVSSATYYQLFVSDSAGERVNRWYTSAQVGCGAGTGVCSIVPAETLAGGKATWWVLTYNDKGYGPWSAGMSLTVAIPAPGTAALVSPSGEAVPAPTFRWNAAVGATWYYLWVTDNSGKPRIQKWYSASQTGCENGGMCSVSPGLVMSPGVNYWWVQTWSSAGGYGAWSAAGTFSVPLAAPSSLGVQTDPQVIYRWGTVEGATHYYLYVSDYTGTARIQKWYSAVELGCVSATTCAVAAPSSVAYGEAQFWIQAWSSDLVAANRPAYSAWSSGLIFKHP